ncbi:HECT domain-containing protein [Hamiltosporidium tvaerminnensis]|uniref:HECT-type E3 ubiquitin transferase n=1 Tax=Hamiltosporidium tvaerminnensis TaxID=1176355 RepID=A0A4Q9LAU6_9MICR|nr:HECT domain-containing protein [Hamiltosporidium tvaerminnensis]
MKSTKLMKNILFTYYNSKKYQYFVEIFKSEIWKLKISEQYSKFQKKIEILENIVNFYSHEIRINHKNMILCFVLFELMNFKENENCFSDTFTIIQYSLNTKIYKMQNEDVNILYQILQVHKKDTKGLICSVLNVYLYSFEKLKLFTVESFFALDVNTNISKITKFFEEIDSCYDLITENDLHFIQERLENFLYFFEYILEDSLNAFFVIFFDFKNKILFVVFEKCIKILGRCCKLYSLTRKLIFNNEELYKYKDRLIYKDFLCFLYKIDTDRISYQAIIYQRNGNFNNLLRTNIFPFYVLSLEIKLMLTALIYHSSFSHFYDQFLLLVDRNNIIDSIVELFENDLTENFLLNDWKVTFVNENGECIGLLYLFFLLYGKAINENAYFMPFKTLDFACFIAETQEEQAKIESIYYYTGIIMAKRYNYEFGHGTNKIMNLHGSEVDTDVTKENLEEYIRRITEFKVYKGMKPYLDKLKEGFNYVILEGENKINIAEWKATTQYSKEYSDEDQLIICFWDFVEKLDDIARHKLLFFVTGLEKLPIGGFKSSKFLEHLFRIDYTSCKNLLPKAQTCFNLLILPKYDDENTLIKNLKLAMETIDYALA